MRIRPLKKDNADSRIIEDSIAMLRSAGFDDGYTEQFTGNVSSIAVAVKAVKTS